MTDKVLYRCERCGNARLLESFDGLLRFCSDGHEKETMRQVWPSGWISVEERLPEISSDGSERVEALVWFVADDGFAMWRTETWAHWVSSDGPSWTGWLSEPKNGRYTHWQPGPSAPEERKLVAKLAPKRLDI